MSISKLIQELEHTPPDEPFDWPAFSDRLNAEFVAAASSEERGELLAARAIAMDFAARQLELHGEQLEKFTDACELEYKRLIVLETRVQGIVSFEKMLEVTDREIAAGRMSEDYALRTIAIEESGQAAQADKETNGEQRHAAAGKFAMLKHWLHIE